MADYELGQSKSGEERERDVERKKEEERERERGRDIDRARQQRKENRLFSIVAQGEGIKESSSL